MPTLRGRSLALLVSLVPSWGCSLMGLDDFGVKPCKLDTDCRNAETQLRPSASACGAAVCQKQEGVCQWRENQETCNGKDDDCNGLIDDGLDLVVKASSLAAIPAVLAYSSAVGSAQTFVAMQSGDGVSQGFTLPDVTANQLSYDSTLGPMNCPKTQAQVAAKAVASCDFSEVALAADSRHLVVASINTSGCAAGQLRVGLGEIDSTPFDVWLGKAADAQTEDPCNIEFGVDVDEHDCTGRSLSADAGASSASGATRPAVATLGTEAGGDGALLLWLAAPANSTDDPADSIPVEAMGLAVSAEQPVWLNGMNGGEPIELGRSTVLSAPAVVALKASAAPGKYLVAFPAAKDGELGILLQTVGRDGLPLGLSSFRGVGAVDQVSLALGNTERAEVGVAWRSGSGADAQLSFMVVSSADLSGGEPWSTPAPNPRFALQLLYRQAGFAKPVGLATDDHLGGWFLSWVEAISDDEQTFRVVRLREGTLQSLGESSLQAAGIPLLYPSTDDDWSVGYAVLQPATSKSHLEAIPLWCQ